MRNSSSNCASVVAANGAWTPAPALLTRTSNRSRPNDVRSTSPMRRRERGERRAVADVERQHDGRAAGRCDLGHDGVRVGAATQVGSDDVGAAAGEVQRDAAAEAATGAGDERDSSGHAASVRPSASAGAPDAAEVLPDPVSGRKRRLPCAAARFSMNAVATALDELRDIVRRHCAGEGATTPIPGGRSGPGRAGPRRCRRSIPRWSASCCRAASASPSAAGRWCIAARATCCSPPICR